MNLVSVTPPVDEPIDLASAKVQLRVDETADDDLIESLITAAREHVEDITRRAILTQTWDYSIPAWPRCDYIKLPLGNLQATVVPAIHSVKWKDTDGVETTLTLDTDYLWETNGEGCGRVVLPYGMTWPSGTLYPSNPITVRFVCGWESPDLIPQKIKAALLLILTDLYENRSSKELTQTAQAFVENKTVDALLASARLWDEF